MSFDNAVEFVNRHKSDARLSEANVQLHLYALFKLATVGPAPAEGKASFFDVVGKAKERAWMEATRSGLDSEGAKLQYCAFVQKLVGDEWRPKDTQKSSANNNNNNNNNNYTQESTANDDDNNKSFFLFQSQEVRAASSAKHAFWSTQPLPNTFGSTASGPPEMIDKAIGENIPTDPLPLPEELNLSWCNEEWKDAPLKDICEEVHTLSKQGLEKEVFTFSPDTSFLEWSMSPPNMQREFLVGFRNRETRQLLGFICGLPMSVSIDGVVIQKLVEIKNMYVHPSLRGFRLAPVLISEVSRRVRLCGYLIAMYTSSVTITRPVCKARFYQRPINLAKLVAVRYKEISRGQTLARLQQKHLPDASGIPAGWRPLNNKDETEIISAYKLLRSHLSQFRVHQVLSEAEFRYWFVNPHPSVHAFVSVSAATGIVEAFCAWHVMEAHISSNAGFPTVVRGAFCHYNAVDSSVSGLTLSDVFRAQIVQAARDDVDVIMCLDIGGNEDFLLDFEATKAEVTPEYLLYHLYNFVSPPVENEEFAIHFF